jgi:hypothetical protein
VSDEPFLSRWSRRKSESEAGTAGPTADSVPIEPAPVVLKPGGAELPATVEPEAPPETLPPVESLTPESDFTPFMKAEVEPGLKREAFKKLIEDPRFNVMDGLDVYIDDYSKPDPLPEGWLEKMNQVKHLGIFKAPDEEAEAPTAPAAEPLQKTMAEQPLAEVEEAPPADTSAEEIPPSRVGKAGVSGEGV